jgi:hypothetical protein
METMGHPNFEHGHAFCFFFWSVGVGQMGMLSNLLSRYPNMTRTLCTAVISPLAINFILVSNLLDRLFDIYRAESILKYADYYIKLL